MFACIILLNIIFVEGSDRRGSSKEAVNNLYSYLCIIIEQEEAMLISKSDFTVYKQISGVKNHIAVIHAQNKYTRSKFNFFPC